MFSGQPDVGLMLAGSRECTGEPVDVRLALGTPGPTPRREVASRTAWTTSWSRCRSGGEDCEPGARRGPASESCRQAAGAGSRSRSSSARMTSWTCDLRRSVKQQHGLVSVVLARGTTAA